MRILVTGGSGLVGSHVIEQLAHRGVEVRALVRSEAAAGVVETLGATPVAGDVCDRAAFEAAARGVDAIVHGAAIVATTMTYDRFEEVNVEGAVNAVEAAAAAGARLVHLSSTSVYGRKAGRALRPGSVDEAFPFARLARRDYYARTKRAAEDALFRRSRARRVHATALRPCVIYGERDRLFSRIVAGVIRRRWVPLVGDGRNVLPCVYAGNVAGAVVAALEAAVPPGGAYNVTNDGALSTRQFVQAFAEGLGVAIRLVRFPIAVAVAVAGLGTLATRLVRPHRYAGVGSTAVHFLTAGNAYSSRRACDELGWTPETPAPVAVRQTGAWFRRS